MRVRTNLNYSQIPFWGEVWRSSCGCPERFTLVQFIPGCSSFGLCSWLNIQPFHGNSILLSSTNARRELFREFGPGDHTAWGGDILLSLGPFLSNKSFPDFPRFFLKKNRKNRKHFQHLENEGQNVWNASNSNIWGKQGRYENAKKNREINMAIWTRNPSIRTTWTINTIV